MSAKATTVGFFLELRKRLQSGLLIVGKDVAGDPPEVRVTAGDSSLLVLSPRASVRFEMPAGVSYEPESSIQTAGGESSREEMHFRLRINIDHQHSDEEASADVIERLRVKESYCFYCQGCKTRLLEDRVFKRVLPLPNGNWNAIVDDWCCHPDPFANNKKLLPRPEDCLVGDTFILLARDGGCEETLTQERGPVGTEGSQDPKKPCHRLMLVSCKSCLSVLGEAVASETLKLYITEVVVEPSVGDYEPDISLLRSRFLEQTISARLLALSSTLSSFRYSIQTPDEKAFLLLWLLNSDSITASIPERQAVSEDGEDEPVTLGQQLGPHIPSCRAARAQKVLYIACSDQDLMQREILTSWEVSAIGHPLVLPLKTCEELEQLMDDSNSSLPTSLRRMKEFKVAYLRLSYTPSPSTEEMCKGKAGF